MDLKKRYSNLVQEKVFAMHASILAYIDDCGNEEKFWDMEDMIMQCRVVVPEQIYNVVHEFVNQYLKRDLYGGCCDKKEGKKFDFSKFELLETKCPYLEGTLDYIICFNSFKFKAIYEAIALEYLRPVFSS